VKLSGFMLSGAIAGIAGALDVLMLHSLSPGAFPTTDSITVFSWTVIGGMGSLTGALVGVLFYKFTETLTFLGTARATLNGAALLLVLYFLPGGLGQVLYSVRDRWLRFVAGRRGILVPSLVADKRVTEGGEHAADEAGLLQGALGEAAPLSNGSTPEPVGTPR
jgi:branched-chain amino acid transport system permease protein